MKNSTHADKYVNTNISGSGYIDYLYFYSTLFSIC